MDVEPIVIPEMRKRMSKSIRIKTRVGSKSKRVRDLSPKKGSDASRVVEEQAKATEAIQEEDNVDNLIDENMELRTELTNMVAIFEQYLKVASLKSTAERI